MLYVYDIMLNFLDRYYEFYEWNQEDEIIHIKKIYLIKVNYSDYNNILNKQVVFDNDFMLSIFNKCEYFNNNKIVTIPYAVLFTDSERIMGVKINEDGKVNQYSSLTLEDEEEIMELSSRIASVKLKYNIIGNNYDYSDKTREEVNIINDINNDLKECYRIKDIDKLKYLYYEFFALESDNIEKIMHDFKKALTEKVSDKHYNLYHLIKLSQVKKRV